MRRRVDAGFLVVSVLHELDLAAAFADRVAILSHGRVLAFGPTQETLSPEHLTRAFGVTVACIETPYGPHLRAVPP